MISLRMNAMMSSAVRRYKAVTVHPARTFAIGVGADYRTPGYVPGKGSALPGNITLQRARTWDVAVADKFQQSTVVEIFKGKKVALFAVPGPFTGTCEKAHVPSFSLNAAALKAKGVDSIVCVSRLDPYVMQGWVNSLGDKAKGIDFYSDDTAKFTEYMHAEVDLSGAALCGLRSNRYALVVNDMTIELLCTEEKPSELKVSDGESILKAL